MPADAVDSFLRLSEALTGFARVDLFGTGLARTYLDTLIGVVGSAAAGELLLAGDAAVGDARPDDPKVVTALAARVVGDARLGPLARNVIRMWYIGSCGRSPARVGTNTGPRPATCRGWCRPPPTVRGCSGGPSAHTRPGPSSRASAPGPTRRGRRSREAEVRRRDRRGRRVRGHPGQGARRRPASTSWSWRPAGLPAPPPTGTPPTSRTSTPPWRRCRTRLPANPAAPAPDVLTLHPIRDGVPDDSGYFHQEGPLPFASDYLRTRGGTTLHWLRAPALRMLPNDFAMQLALRRGVDWPLGYDDLEPWTTRGRVRRSASSADVEDQDASRASASPTGYVYPMHRDAAEPPRPAGRQSARRLTVKLGGDNYPIGDGHRPGPQLDSRTRTTRPGRARPSATTSASAARGTRAASRSARRRPSTTRSKDAADGAPPDKVRVVTPGGRQKVLFDPATGRVTGVEYRTLRPGRVPGRPRPRPTAGVRAGRPRGGERQAAAGHVGRRQHQRPGRPQPDGPPVLLAWALMPTSRSAASAVRGPRPNIFTFATGRSARDHAAFSSRHRQLGLGLRRRSPRTRTSPRPSYGERGVWPRRCGGGSAGTCPAPVRRSGSSSSSSRRRATG